MHLPERSEPLDGLTLGLPIFAPEELRRAVDTRDLIEPVCRALDEFSRGGGHSGVITFAPAGVRGDVHVKSAWLPGGRYFTVKVATWFTDRTAVYGGPSDGYLVVHDARTGAPVAILRDGHHLTDLRTAAAGAATITALARAGSEEIGVIGTGTQAYLQVLAACESVAVRRIRVWGRSPARATRLRDALATQLPDKTVETASTAKDAVMGSDIVITATASHKPILAGAWLSAGQHVVAIGADDPSKRELDPECFRRADVVVVDSRADTPRLGGDLRSAVKAGAVRVGDLVELGDILGGRIPGRRSDEQVTVAKLIGLGVQDLAAAAVVLHKLGRFGERR